MKQASGCMPRNPAEEVPAAPAWSDARLEEQVFADERLSRLAQAWMLGTSRSLQDFITYHRPLIEQSAGQGTTDARDARDAPDTPDAGIPPGLG